MEYLHIRNIEKFHPGYKDRKLQWGKIYIDMVSGDPDCELIDNEIDWGRLVKIILLELRARKPLPHYDQYWLKHGFNIKKRPMSLTIKMLHNFIEVVTQDEKLCTTEKIREDKNKKPVTENRQDFSNEYPFLKNLKIKELWDVWLEARTKKKIENSDTALRISLNKLKKYNTDTIKQMLEQAIERGWRGIFELPENKSKGRFSIR